MDRCAVFVDAGHLLAECGKLCCGLQSREQVQCDYAGLSGHLLEFTARHAAPLPLLRMYWYDGAPAGRPVIDHRSVAALPNVKLRLGRLVGGEQKGVDSLMVLDLVRLAQDRAIAAAYLLSGDEDLREGVLYAQQLGVRLVLLGIPGATPNQAGTLVDEADEHVVLPRAFWEPFFTLRPEPTPAIPPAELPPDAAAIGGWFAADLRVRDPGQVSSALRNRPSVPNPLDRELRRLARQVLGTDPDEAARRELRRAFWVGLADVPRDPGGAPDADRPPSGGDPA